MASDYFTDRRRVTREGSASMIIVNPPANLRPFSLNELGPVGHWLDLEGFSTPVTCDSSIMHH